MLAKNGCDVCFFDLSLLYYLDVQESQVVLILFVSRGISVSEFWELQKLAAFPKPPNSERRHFVERVAKDDASVFSVDLWVARAGCRSSAGSASLVLWDTS